ncbi:hypothetical protein J2Z77_005159 [Streptomyces avidinii]|uniref:Uncharacterized protein n=1 Tax=Streptomyces avidinii TaxID=1895 RepID=A0ABS4LB89_STRAV|nr:hypothetical protein [Streptomyces avidinii]MBP2039333.1 hypothetical protein [Streptomyces avidinii]
MSEGFGDFSGVAPVLGDDASGPGDPEGDGDADGDGDGEADPDGDRDPCASCVDEDSGRSASGTASGAS